MTPSSSLPSPFAFSRPFATRTAPIAPVKKCFSGTTSSPCSSSKTFSKALTTPILAATPPVNTIGFTKSLPQPRLLLRFLASARQRPATMSQFGVACCCRCIISLFAKTEHRPAIRGTVRLCNASSPNSPSISIPSRWACWSRNEPVPAAHTVFRAKSRTLLLPSCLLIKISLLSWPPISIIVACSKSGYNLPMAAACAGTSLTNVMPAKEAKNLPAVPVAAKSSKSDSPFLSKTNANWSRTVSIGRPIVRR